MGGKVAAVFLHVSEIAASNRYAWLSKGVRNMLDLIGLGRSLSQQLLATFNPNSPYGAPALLGALIFAIAFYVVHRRRRGQAVSAPDFFRTIFPARIVAHPSTWLDMRMWIINALVLASAYSLLAISGIACRNVTVDVLTKLLGAHAPTVWPVAVVLGMTTVLELLAYELAYWFGHFLFHRYAWLWEFHKVHHSAEVMTTFTEMRQHPVEILAFVNLIALATGIVFGVMTYAFGPGIRPFTLLNSNAALMLFLLTYGHLRHSHIWISFTGLAGRLLQSPAHHQVHHSDNPAHWDKNLGFALAVWDWAFGTLYIPSPRHEDITFGVGAENPHFRTVGGNFITPFIRSWEHVSNWLRGPKPADVGAGAAH